MQYTLKKSLGQHFLKDEHVIRKIIAALQLQLSLTGIRQLLEVGPGAGALTMHLLQLSDIDLKAVELDEEKVQYLEKKFPALTGRIIHQDFLDTVPAFENEFIVIGNFPYNISSQILFKILDWKTQVPITIGMFQKEVAVRIAAKPGNKDYGILSVLVQAFYTVNYLFDVSPGCFNPPPKVMSGMIQLKRKDSVCEMRSQKAFFNLVKTAFNQRRKMLRNAVKSLFLEEVLADSIFTKRAEQLSVEDFAALTFRMK
ncbi:MAG TPA: 16S rRNA (adenine(1518)-N(6)/adenine(1519)-N(6))-dimethyltransferase RsmA [Panacibacter sp.]|nr:16S rRNA (adenine(1518)-N(6)/adenine(1519)-N(6))-dimethyltransferase RsmA [Panacibacter sp.]HNP43826.1 16S rRNA (adenine(1518)-N(6)/adenine(1519)-N(6))-dimethyltransferase RsmA [Panacibacter sp.]